jgi:PAS domain S-box-containing protein
LFSLGYFLTAEVSFYLMVPHSPFIAMWLPAGLYVAVLLLNEHRDWPWLVLAVLPANVAFDVWHGTPPLTILLFYFVNTFEAVLGAWLMHRFVARRPTLATLKEFLGLVVCSGVVSTMLGAVICAGALTAMGASHSFPQAWLNWWTGEATAILLFTPFILTWSSGPVPGQEPFLSQPKKIAEAAVLVAVSILLTWHLLFVAQGVMAPNKSSVLLPLVWAALRFGPRGATAASLLLALPMAFFTTQFTAGLTPAQVASGVFIPVMQFALATAAMVALIPAIIIRNHQNTIVQLNESEERFRNLTAAAFEGIFITENGRVVDANDQGLKMFGYERAEMIGREVGQFISPETRAAVLEAIRSNRETVYEHQLIRKDGSRFHAEAQAKMTRVGSRNLRMTAIRDITDRKRAEASLIQSEARFSRIFNTSPIPISLIRLADGVILDANESFVRMSGFTRDEILGHTALELNVYPDPAQRVYIMEQLHRHGHLHGHEQLFRAKSGQIRNHRLWLDVVSISGEQCFLVLGLDITEQKLADIHIQHLNRVYAVLSDINQTIVREKDPSAMLTAACRTAVEKGGFLMAWAGLADAATGRLELTAHAGASDETLKVLKATLNFDQTEGGCAFTLHAWQSGGHGICNNIQNDPQTVPWRAAALDQGYRAMASLPLKRHGRVTGTFNLYAGEVDFFDAEEMRLLDELATDISFALEAGEHETKRRQAEQELRWRTAFFEAQVHSAMDGILVVDREGKKILQNDRMTSLWKIPPAIAADLDDSKQVRFVLTRVKNSRAFVEKINHLYAHPDETSVDEIDLVDGTILERYSAPVRGSDGTHYGRVWIFRDLTDSRKMEAQLRQMQKMEAVGQLAGGVAHDFNNLLAVIEMQVELFKMQGGFSPEQSECIDEIQLAAGRAANLTRQLLLFSRKQALQLRDLDLNDCVINITKMLQRILGEQVQIQVRYATQPLFVHADAGMMDQLLMNLTVNARDAMPNGGLLVIETSTAEIDGLAAAQSPQSRPGSFVCLSVSDTGCGIPPENLSKIFNPFFTTKEVGKGTGLGLATVFGILQQHQGWVEVRSEVGRGSTFQIYLPRLAGMAGQKSTPAAPAAAHGGHETILLVEDDPSLRTALQKMLSKLGYHILEAATGAEALYVWQTHRDEIRLMVTDMVMPGGMTGRELAEKILADAPVLKVVYVSGYSPDLANQSLHLVEGVNFLTKPFEAHKLAQTIRNCLDGAPPAS